MIEFLQSAAGRAVLGVLIAVIIVLLTALNYKYFMKSVLDFIFSFILVICLSPLIIILAIVAKIKNGQTLESAPYLGVKGQIIYLHTFALNGKIKYIARVLDVLLGRMSFVGVKPLNVRDGAFVDDEAMERFNARPGLVCHMIVGGYEDFSYAEMFEADIRYAKTKGLFKDIFMVLKALLYAVRGEGKSYLGEAENCDYTTALLNSGKITERDAQKAEEYAEEAIGR